jgi:hypothetical protein
VRGGLKRIIAFTAYTVSTVAALLHVRAVWVGDPLPSPIGMQLLTYAFIVLVVPWRRSRAASPALGAHSGQQPCRSSPFRRSI